MAKAYELLPSQQEFLFCDNDVSLDVCVYQGGYGSGKTWIGSLLGLMLAERYPGSLGVVLAKTYPMVRDTTLRTYFEHLDSIGLERNIHYTFNKSESRLVFPIWGNSEIIFRHLQDPDTIKSINAAWIECEEISQFTEADFMMVLSRVRQAGIPRYRVFGHTNPQAAKGWIHRIFEQDNIGKQTIKLDDGRDAVIHYRRIIAPTTENKHLSPHYIANLKDQYDEEYYRINVLGQDGDYTAGLVCKTWSNANIDDTPYRPDMRIYLSCDFNVDPMSWVMAHRFNGEYHFFDELVIENTTTVQAAEEFARRYAGHSKGIIITGDASGKNRNTAAADILTTNYTIIRNTLSSLGFRDVQLDIRTANPSIDSRVAAWNGIAQNSQGVVRVKVNPKCKWLIYNCENLKYIPGTSVIWEPTPKLIEQDAKLKFTKHIWDAASYLVERYDPISLNIDPAHKARNKFVSARFTA